MIPTSEIKTLQHSLDGSPWARIVLSSTVEPDTLELSVDGSPWWGVIEPAPSGGQVKNWDSVPLASWKTIYGIPIAQVKKINGIPI